MQLSSPTLLFTLWPDPVARYLLSTGINIGHTDFGGRATHGYNGVPGSLNDDVSSSTNFVFSS